MLLPLLSPSGEVPRQWSCLSLLQPAGPCSSRGASHVCRVMLAQNDVGHVHWVRLVVSTGKNWQCLPGDAGGVRRVLLVMSRGSCWPCLQGNACSVCRVMLLLFASEVGLVPGEAPERAHPSPACCCC